MSLNAPSPEEAHSVSSLRELMETTTTAAATASASDIKPPSRPSSVIPNILASLAATSPANIPSKQHELSPRNEGEREHEHMATKSATQTPTHLHHQHQLTTTTTTPPRSNTRSSSPAYEIPHSASPHSERSSSGSNSAGAPQQFCLRWNNYQSNLTSVFDQLLQTESFVDVTLACDGRSIKAHKMVLSACSPYFQSLFSDIPCQHPIVIMKDVGWLELKTIVDFMYKGEINVSQEQIGPLLRIAEMLKVRGLADVGNIETATSSMRNARETPRTKRQRSHTPPAKHHAQDFDGDHRIAAKDFLFFAEPDKKQHIEKAPIWNIDADASSRAATMATNNPNASAVELSLSPLPLPTPHANLLTRNVRKRRWTSADALFNPTASPLSGLIAAERAEQEQERARQRERECERLLLTPPIPTIVSAGMTSSHHMTGCKTHPTSTSSAGPSTQSVNPMEISSRSSPTQSSSVLLPPARTPTGMLTPSPHLQLPHSLQHSTGHHSQQTSPALSVASTQPSSVFSSGGGGGGNHLTPSPANITSGTSSSAGESHRFSMGSAQAAAMAAAAATAHIDLTPSPHAGLSMGPHPPPSVPIGGVATHHHHPPSIADDLEIKPGIAEMIREEERAKMLENTHAWMSSGPSIADSYQYQLQSMWQKCWNTNQSLMHHLRFRERGPLKSWRPETMAEAIFSVLKEGLSLSQAARKYDIPYPTFVLYANRVHNMLGPSIDGGPDLRPKGRGRPQRILLGIWPDEHIKGVIKTVVFRDAKDLKEETFTHLPYGRHSPVFPFQDGTLGYSGPGSQCANGIPTPTGDQMTQEATAAAVAAVAHNFRQQMQMAAAQHQHQQHTDSLGSAGLFSIPPHLTSAAAVARGAASPLTGPPGPGGLMLPKASISPALSTTSNPSGGGVVVGPRHQPSPCTSALSGMHQLGPGMAAALQMVGVPGRCETATLLSQQQQHQQQLQQLHLQQQHAALHHQQQKHSHQHQQMLFGTSSLGHQSSTPSAMATSSIASPQQISTTKSSSSSISSSPERMRHSMPVDMPLRSSFTEFGFDLGHNKSSRSFSPARLFPDDIAELVGVTPASRNHHQSMLLTPASNTTTTTTTTTKSNTPSDITTSVSSNIATSQTTTTSTTSNKSSSSVKIEPITTTSE